MIYYGLCGEGHGHASRCLSVADMFPNEEFHVFTYKTGYDFISGCISQSSNIKLHKIRGFGFKYKNGSVVGCTNPIKSLSILKDNHKEFKRYFSDKVDLVITDWEFSISRFAQKYASPCISIDNQHKFKFGNFNNLNLDFANKLQLGLSKALCPIVVPYCNDYIICTFSNADYEKYDNVYWCPIIPGEDLEKNKNSVINEGITLGYFLQDMFERVRHLVPKDCVLYSERPIEGFKYRPLNRRNFVQDLIRCDKVMCTAGNTLISEALYLGKKIEVFPIKNHFEQSFNKMCLDNHGDHCIESGKDVIKQVITKYI